MLMRAPVVEHGFSLVELVVTMLVISIAVLGITSALSFGLRHQSDGLWQAKSLALIDSYVEEILSRRFDEASPPGGVPPCDGVTCSDAASFDDGETRAEYDDVDDYDGLVENPPRWIDGTVRAGYDGYAVSIQVRYPTAAEVTTLGLGSAIDAKLITVNVAPPGLNTLSVGVVKTNF